MHVWVTLFIQVQSEMYCGDGTKYTSPLVSGAPVNYAWRGGVGRE